MELDRLGRAEAVGLGSLDPGHRNLVQRQRALQPGAGGQGAPERGAGPSSLTIISAQRCLTAWKAATGRPNCWRSLV
jgi:hypothetical protein